MSPLRVAALMGFSTLEGGCNTLLNLVLMKEK